MKPVGDGHFEGIHGLIVIEYDQGMSEMDSHTSPRNEQRLGQSHVLCPAIRFIPGINDVDSHVVYLEINSADHLRNLKHRDAPAAFVVPAPFLEKLATFKDLIVHRGTKDERKGLAELMLGRAQIPIIRGTQKSVPQLVRSMRTLIRRAQAAADRNLFFVGVSERLHGRLFDMTRQGSKQHTAARRTVRHAKESKSRPDDVRTISRQLVEELSGVEVPETLVTDFVGSAIGPDAVRRLIMAVAPTSEPVLILGETGTGKELVAKGIHDFGDRRGPLIALNCSGIPADLFESELCGYVKGAHSTAYFDKAGRWELAENGTLFLDEIGDLHLALQAKILRILEDHKIVRLGATNEIPVNARIVAATNRDLPAMVREGLFREDLYFRLRGFVIRTPSLREHPEDIPALVHHLWRRITGDDAAPLPPEVLRGIASHDWPGNVRELKSVLKCLHILYGTRNLDEQKLQTVFMLLGQTPRPSVPRLGKNPLRVHLVDCLAHLNRTQEVIRACETSLKPLLSKQVMNHASCKRMVKALNQSVIDLVALRQRPNLFFTEALFRLTSRFAEMLTNLSAAAGDDVAKACRLWESRIVPIHQQLVSRLFEETHNLLRAALKFPPGWRNQRGEPGAN